MLPCPYTEHDARSFLTRAVTGWDEESDGHFAVVDAAGRHVGGARLRPVGDPAVAEIGYRVVPAARRRGVATAVTRTLTRWALHDLGFARVQIRAERLNRASVGVALKAGFTREGVLRSHEVDRGGARRDDVLFSALADEPR
jgi:RimJ/RimL family protein N-acetyltransferase